MRSDGMLRPRYGSQEARGMWNSDTDGAPSSLVDSGPLREGTVVPGAALRRRIIKHTIISSMKAVGMMIPAMRPGLIEKLDPVDAGAALLNPDGSDSGPRPAVITAAEGMLL